MFKKFIIIFISMSVLYGKYIPSYDINTSQYTLKISECYIMECYLDTISKIKKHDDYHTIEQNNRFTTYLVNLKDDKQIDALKEKYKNLFPNPSVYRASDLKIQQKQKPKKTSNTKTLTKKIILDTYKQALIHFKNKNYTKSYTMFQELFNNNLNDPNINFYLGRSAFELKKYQESLVAYERVLFEKPDSLRTQLEMARAYFLSKEYKSAKKMFQNLEENPKVPGELKQNIAKYLSVIDTKIPKHFFNGMLMAGVTYDSNLKNRSKHDSYYSPLINDNVTTTTLDASGWAIQEVGVFNYLYKKDDMEQFKNTVMIYNRDMRKSEYSSDDVTLININPIYQVKYNQKLNIDYSLFSDIMWLDNKKYINTYGVSPKISYMYDVKNTIISTLKYQKKSYAQSENKSKNSVYKQIDGSIKHNYKSNLIFTPTLTVAKERKNDNNQVVVDYDCYSLGLNTTYIYRPYLLFNPSIIYKKTKYKDMDTSFNKKAKHTNMKYGIVGTYIHSTDWIFNTNLSFTKQSSNIAKDEYDKYNFGFNVIRSF